MNRLTKGSEKHNNEYISYVADSSLYPEMMGYEQTQADIDAINKLGRLEDIEEELGISLLILFKALKNGIIVELDDEKDELDGWRLSISFEKKCFVYINFWGKFGIDFKDYGKTWWLKEDLKSE